MFGSEQIDKRKKASRKRALGLPRREARELDNFLKSVLPAPIPGYSRPLLGRALAEFALRRRAVGDRAHGPIIFLFAAPITLLPIAWFEGAGSNEFGFLVAAYYFEMLLLAWVITLWDQLKTAAELKRVREFSWKLHLFIMHRVKRSAQRSILVFVLLLAGAVIFLAYRLEPGEFLPLSIRATVPGIWAIVLVMVWASIMRRSVARMAPQAVLVQMLANTCGTLMAARPAQWRNVRYRSIVAAQLGAAAAIVEGASLRILAGIPVPRETPEWRHVRASAGGLRQLAARAVTRGTEAKAEIERSVALALATAVAGALVSVESDTPPEDEAAIASRLGLILRGMRNVVIAFLPAIGVAAIILGGDRYGWEWADEARPLLIQFAVVSVLIGLMSALDPSGYQQRLSAITGAGGSLFGRRG